MCNFDYALQAFFFPSRNALPFFYFFCSLDLLAWGSKTIGSITSFKWREERFRFCFLCLSNHYSFTVFTCFSLLSSTSLSFSLEVLDIAVLLLIFYSSSWSINMFRQSCCGLLNFFLSFDFKDASSVINARRTKSP